MSPTSKTYLQLLRVQEKQGFQQNFNKVKNINYFFITFAPVNLNNLLDCIVKKPFKGFLNLKRVKKRRKNDEFLLPKTHKMPRWWNW